MDVASEVQIDIVHRDDLRQAASGTAATGCKPGGHGRFAQAERRLVAKLVHRIGQTDTDRCLTFPALSRRDRRNKDQLAIWHLAQAGNMVMIDLRNFVSKGNQIAFRDAQGSRDVANGFLLRGSGNLDIVGHNAFFPSKNRSGVDITGKTRNQAAII